MSPAARPALPWVLALVPLAVTLLVFFPQLLGLDAAGDAPPVAFQAGAVLVATFAAAAVAQGLAHADPVRTGLVVAAPTAVVGGLLGLAAALEAVHLVVVGVLVLAVIAAALAGTWLVAQRRARGASAH